MFSAQFILLLHANYSIMLTKVIDQANIDHFAKWLDKAENMVIVTHVSPDGDAIGSSLGLAHFLEGQDKNVRVIVPNAFPDFLRWMDGAQQILRYDKHPDEADKLIAETLHVTPHNDSHHHSKYNHHGVTIESHFDFVNTHTPPSNKAYEQMLKQLDPHGATFEALFLARHHSCHFASDRITLRNLCDWALFLQARSHEIDLAMVADAFRQFNMHQFVGALEAIRTRMLHMPGIPELHFEISEKLYQRVLNDILHGEFNVPDPEKPGLRRLVWKLRRHSANHWKHSITCNDTYSATMISSLFSHLKKPKSILKKM